MSAIDAIKSEIAVKRQSRVQLDDDITALEKALSILTRGKAPVQVPSHQRELAKVMDHIKSHHPRKGKIQAGSLSDLVRSFLREAGKPLHADQLQAQLAGKGRRVAKATLLSPLYRLAKKKVVFRQTSPATFALLEWDIE